MTDSGCVIAAQILTQFHSVCVLLFLWMKVLLDDSSHILVLGGCGGPNMVRLVTVLHVN